MNSHMAFAVHALSQLVSTPEELMRIDINTCVAVHLGTGEYCGTIRRDNKLVAMTGFGKLYQPVFDQLRLLVVEYFNRLAAGIPETRIVYAPKVPPLDVSRVKIRRIRPETARKRFSFGELRQKDGKRMDEVFWLETEFDYLKFVVFRRACGIEVCLFSIVDTGVRDPDGVSKVQIVQLGAAKQVPSEAAAENEAIHWYYAFAFTLQMIRDGVISFSQWFDRRITSTDEDVQSFLAAADGEK